MQRFRRIALVLLILLVGAATGLVAWREPLLVAWWEYQGSRPLTAEQAAVVASCGELGWAGAVRVLQQDAGVACADGWGARLLAPFAERLRGRWLAEVAADSARTPLQRYRAGIALAMAGRDLPPDLSLLATDPRLPEAQRSWVVEALVMGELVGDWPDPKVRLDAAIADWSDGNSDLVAEAALRLRLEAALASAPARPTARSLAEHAATEVGFTEADLAAWRSRRAEGRSLGGVPPALLDLVANDTRCARLDGPDCLRWLAEALEETVDPSGDAHEPGVEAPRPLWEILYGGDEAQVEAASRFLGRFGRWVAEAPEAGRPARLLGAIAGEAHGYGPESAGAGELGDPLAAAWLRRSSPWASALAALALAEASATEVRVYAEGDAVRLISGGHHGLVGPCGTTPPPPPEGTAPTLGEPVSARRVLARAAVEAVAGSVITGDASRARRIAAFAERVDPTVAAGLVRWLDGRLPSSPDASRSAGRVAGRRLSGAPGEGSWDLASISGCPVLRGP